MTPNNQKTTSSRTVPRTFRISHTQSILLANPKIKTKASAIIRVLLQLYFNKRITGVDLLIENELKATEQAMKKQLDDFRIMLKTNNPKGRGKLNGTTGNSI